jgi:inhibitor of KinA sporulation pathway (predicted exonuclease)
MTHYICILDFEATCWEGERNDSIREIIEFPSILYSIDFKHNITKIDEFDQFIKPTINPILSEFCTKLTGITQDLVNSADTFDKVYDQHYQWLQTYIPDLNKMIIITCGRWDIADMLPLKICRHSLEHYNCYKKYVNIRDEFNAFYNKNAGSMVNMLTKLKLELVGKHHSGIDDCRNISQIVIKMIKDGFKCKQFSVKRIN